MTGGLRHEHLRRPPLLEKVAHIPASERGAPGTTSSTRVYEDGSFYMLAGEAAGSPGPTRWTYLFRVKPEGIQRLLALFAEVCATPDSLRGDDLGRVDYHVSSPRCTRSFVNGLPSNQSPIRAADDIISAHSGTIESSR